jgi:hypothetical protein
MHLRVVDTPYLIPMTVCGERTGLPRRTLGLVLRADASK